MCFTARFSLPTRLCSNERLWRYQLAAGFLIEFVAAPLLAVTAADLAASGQVDLVSLDQAGHVQRWQPDKHGNWKARELARIEMSGSGHAGIAALDLTGNGRPELLIHHSREIVVLALGTDGMAERLWSHAWSQPAELLALTPILIDPSRGPALAGVVRDGEQSSLMLWPAGSGRHDFVPWIRSGLFGYRPGHATKCLGYWYPSWFVPQPGALGRSPIASMIYHSGWPDVFSDCRSALERSRVGRLCQTDVGPIRACCKPKWILVAGEVHHIAGT